jgi:hypothetical protein
MGPALGEFLAASSIFKCFGFEDVDEGAADELPLGFWVIGDTFEAVKEEIGASTTVKLMPRFSVNVFLTCSHSLRRMQPLSTRTAWNRSPMASCMSFAATVESTPPLTAPRTCPLSPTKARILAISLSTNLAMVQSCFAPHIPTAKFSSSLTASWCMGYLGVKLYSINGFRFVCNTCKWRVLGVAIVWNEAGSAPSLSPWDIHTLKSSSKSLKSLST